MSTHAPVRVRACVARCPHGSRATILSGSDHEGKGPIRMAGSVEDRSSACHEARARAHGLTQGTAGGAGDVARLCRGDLPARHTHRAVDRVGPVVRAWLGLGLGLGPGLGPGLGLGLGLGVRRCG